LWIIPFSTIFQLYRGTGETHRSAASHWQTRIELTTLANYISK